jgi:glucose/arabinose dehydrogenase
VLAAIAGAAAAAAVPQTLVRTQTLPLGFTVDVLASNQHGPIALDLLPDGRVLFVEQDTGNVKVLANGGVAVAGTVPDLAVSYSRGLLAIAVDPGWPTRPFVYVVHSHAPAGDQRISRLAATGALADPASTNLQLGQAYVVLDGIPDQAPIHDGACLRFGRDGMLYASLGDDGDPCASQDLDRLDGKLLRLDVAHLPAGGGGPPPRGSLVPPGNPFAGPTDVARLCWALGLRNPFRFHVDPANGALFVADVGDAQLDEIDRITAGGRNLGWPWFEGTATHTGCAGAAPAADAPIAVQTLGPGFTALISLGVYRVPANAPFHFGPGYDGSFFYADHFSGRMWRLAERGGAWGLAPQAAGQPSAELWATGLSWITDARVGDDGAVYVCERPSSTTGSIRRVRPTGAAAFAPFGGGCAGSGGVPALLANGRTPRLGQPFVLDLGSLPTPTAAIGVLGLQKDRFGALALPLDLAAFGMPGCTALVDAAAAALVPGRNGAAAWSLAIPNANALSGLCLFAQALALDHGANAAGIVVTNGGEGIVR